MPTSKKSVPKKIATGTSVYALGAAPVAAHGHQFTEAEMMDALEHRLPSVIWDDAGTEDVADVLAGVASTAFETAKLEEALHADRNVEDWQVGEAIAESYLTDHSECSFPWPPSRDLRNPTASGAGADLVGFHQRTDGVRFALGEVKTSSEASYPPQVMTGRHGMQKQLETLRDSREVKDHLVLRYLALRAKGSPWLSTFIDAAKRYVASNSDVSLFGLLVRDVAPNEKDLSARLANMKKKCPGDTVVELRAFYFPFGSIKTFPERVKSFRKTA